MATWPTNPAVCEVNTWVWLRDLGREYGLPVSLQNVPQAELERLAALHFDGVWLMGLWERSPASRRIAQEDARLQMAYRQALSDFTPEDVIGSPYAVHYYPVDPRLGGDAGLAALRERLRQLGLLLILDFVPNHLAIDHPWVADHPDRLVQDSPESLQREPYNYFESAAGDRTRVFAHGRDPSFGGWTVTVQLDYRRPETRQAMADVLVAVAERCDGVRCDMAMLVTHDVFLRTWGGAFDPPGARFWPATISAVRARYPNFLMLAEVYWDMEYELQKLGFDYTYDKRLYDRLVHGSAGSIRAHLGAGQNNQDRLDNLNYQRHLARFLENHDEERAVAAFGLQRGLAAAVAALMLPGFRLLHEGQLEGRRLRLPVQLGRRQPEPAEPGAQSFHRRLLEELAGTPRSRSSAYPDSLSHAACSRTAPFPFQIRSPAASSRSSPPGNRNPTSKTSSAPPGPVAGAVHEHCPPGSNGSPTDSDHRPARPATIPGSPAIHSPSPSSRDAVSARYRGTGNAAMTEPCREPGHRRQTKRAAW
jgi:glycosidase